MADGLEALGAARSASARDAAERATGALTAVLDALAELRGEHSPEAIIESAPRALCRTGVFDRVLWSDVRGSLWRPRALYTVDDQVHRQLDGITDGVTVPLASPLIEAEVVRRRMPALVNDAGNEPRTYAPLVAQAGSTDYVVAPVVVMSAVTGLLHADRVGRSPLVIEADRDLLRLFAEGLGVLCERAMLNQRAEDQRRSINEVCAAAARALADLDGAPEVALTSVSPAVRRPPAQPGRAAQQRGSARLSRLTAREREVLSLLASGATNAQLADRLTVAESTVKSHVKHILHKLGAGNRAAAIACYLRESKIDERWPR